VKKEVVAVAAVHVVVEALVVAHVDVVFFWGIFAGFEFVVIVVTQFIVAQTFSKTVVREVIINKIFFVLLCQVFRNVISDLIF
jgi:hypothetical protein